jgi:Lactate racemase N-terminal domain
MRLTKIRQRFERNGLHDPLVAVREQLARLDELILPRARIAIAVGSRGIDNLSSIVKEVVAYVRGRGALPFIVPAMGSHGGATAEGQTEVLNAYGISEQAVHAPVHATMEVVELEKGDLPINVFMDRHAYESDGVILVNRIKPHTDFHGRYESGLMKMALIGLGKREGAFAIHQFGVYGLREFIGPGARRVLAEGKILGGVGLVEDAYHRTMVVKVLKPNEMADGEPQLLELARRNMPRLPVKAIDVLVIDRMGKDINGVGMDPNVTGRIGVNGEHDPTAPSIGAMIVCDLTDRTQGNAIGVGLADVITRRLYDKIEHDATYANVITSSFLERGKIPIAVESDRKAFEVARRSCGQTANGVERIVRIVDTLHLEDVYVSPAVLDELRDTPSIEIVERDVEMFTEAGSLTPF